MKNTEKTTYPSLIEGTESCQKGCPFIQRDDFIDAIAGDVVRFFHDGWHYNTSMWDSGGVERLIPIRTRFICDRPFREYSNNKLRIRIESLDGSVCYYSAQFWSLPWMVDELMLTIYIYNKIFQN